MKYVNTKIEGPFGSSEAVWRILKFPISERSPAVYEMRVDLTEQQIVYFHQGVADSIIANERIRKTELKEFFTFNRSNPDTKISYFKFSSNHTWDKSAHRWKTRQKYFGIIGRILTVHPSSVEVSHLRWLLGHNHSAGAMFDLIGPPFQVSLKQY